MKKIKSKGWLLNDKGMSKSKGKQTSETETESFSISSFALCVFSDFTTLYVYVSGQIF